ncbi:MAG: collagen-like triple helix repeat-containing protein [Cyclobacteriaceae bacterium]
MKKLVKLNLFTFMLLASILIIRCEGPEGPQGEQGDPGIPGDPGNANVTLLRLTQGINWNPGSEIIIDGINVLNENVINNYVILSYFQEYNTLYSIPGVFNYFIIDAQYTFETVRYWAYDSELAIPGDEPAEPEEIRVILIEPTTVVNGRSKFTPQERIMIDLENAGVDIKDYGQVAAYFGIVE